MREGAAVGWGCNQIVPDPHSFQYAQAPPPAASMAAMPITDLRRLESMSKLLIVDWMVDRGAKFEHPFCSVFDIRSHLIYPINQIVSMHGRPCLVLIFHTLKRIPTKDHPEMFWYANRIHTVCVEQYAISPTTILLNAYYKNLSRGLDVGLSAISRHSANPARQRQTRRQNNSRATEGEQTPATTNRPHIPPPHHQTPQG